MSNLPENDESVLNEDVNTAADLPDSAEDAEKMKSETVILDLPEVKDIPGQEHIKVMPLGELADTTISSDDEEGVGILEFDKAGDDEAADPVNTDR